MSASLLLTGDKETDKAMASFENKVQRKYIRQALNATIIKIQNEYNQLVPVIHGAMKDATRRRTPKLKKNQIGRALVILREVYFKLYEARYGRPPGKLTGDDEPFFAPAVVELGDKDTPAQRPMRAALYGSERAMRQEFFNQLRAAVAAAGK